MRAIKITEFGGPEVLVPTELSDPVPGAGQTLVEISRAGVNYADTHAAENSYLAPTRLPLIPVNEVVGTTDDSRRVAAIVDAGGYAERVAVTPALSFDVPDDVDDTTALGLVVQGATAWLLLLLCHATHLAEGESVVVHAAAGGVGTLAVQLAKLSGARRAHEDLRSRATVGKLVLDPRR
ncbi:quinone oxidoreductase family protein [Actinokineospora sp. G85]|uniref:quinone oxidoreductase family protein n=1 Tax=Actinokineospora sp. G85 TaxID=3406626 RepID=UPI003C735FD3